MVSPDIVLSGNKVLRNFFFLLFALFSSPLNNVYI